MPNASRDCNTLMIGRNRPNRRDQPHLTAKPAKSTSHPGG